MSGEPWVDIDIDVEMSGEPWWNLGRIFLRISSGMSGEPCWGDVGGTLGEPWENFLKDFLRDVEMSRCRDVGGTAGGVHQGPNPA
jgi:hypothetical protein